jgi:uncharacterized protein YyaL (SSP411 family)
VSEFRFSPRPNRASEVAWRPWGPEAFTEAKLAQRPVLLAISAVWCHWCHVMDETTYSDPAIIALVNQRYVPVRVDNDQRPDVNRRYNMGGWPSTAFLTPDGEVITGGTYIPPEVMRQYLAEVAELYLARRPEIEQRVAEVRLQEAQRQRSAAGPLQWKIVEDVVAHIRGLYDATYGGFGREPKFPQPHVLRLLLDDYRRYRHDDLAAMLHKTLAAMAGGGMHDAVEGGFFRYATQRDWQVPHYEKMLEDNSELLAVFVEAHRTFPQAGYDRVARDVMRWMRRVLWRADARLFGGSQDADEHYYTLGADARKRLPAPYVDPVPYANWNALAASAFIAAATALSDAEALGVGAAVLGSLRARLWDEAAGTYHFDAGQGPQLQSLLTDLATLLSAQLDLYEAGGGGSALAFARSVAEKLVALEDAQQGGFLDALQREESGRVARPDRPIEDNALAAEALLRLATLTGEERWRELAVRALRSFAGQYREWGQFGALYARAVARALADPLHVVVTGPAEDPRARALWEEAVRTDDPARVLERLDPGTDRERMASLGYPAGEVAAYVCVGAVCSAPIVEADALRREVDRTRERFLALVR